MAARVGFSSGRSLTSLSDEEVLALARAGSRPAVEHLLSRYRPLVEGKARSFFVSGADHEDVVQEGMIGLFKAIRDYQADRLVRFRAFAEICITRQIISAVKTASRRKHLPLNRYVPLHRPWGDEEALLSDVLPDRCCFEPEAVLLGEGLSESLERAGRANLSELERQVIRFRLEGKSYEQMAAELKCRPKCVDNALQRAKRKLWSQIAQAD
ncbi:MAG TPA: RNA polymerase sporulation sigma factor SigH [Armatimonadota bacterium]|nr:RNA polymerase sporulation sigma factor SigH [Armatimonadota bacterium]